MIESLRRANKAASPKGKPAVVRRKGQPTKPNLRWNLTMAEREFGIDRSSFEKRKRALNISPAEDGCFTSRQIAAMLFGDKEAETIGKIAAERRKTELDVEITRKERIPLDVLNSVNAEAFGAIAALIKSHRDKPLTQEVIDDINTALRDIPHKLRWMKSA